MASLGIHSILEAPIRRMATNRTKKVGMTHRGLCSPSPVLAMGFMAPLFRSSSFWNRKAMTRPTSMDIVMANAALATPRSKPRTWAV